MPRLPPGFLGVEPSPFPLSAPTLPLARGVAAAMAAAVAALAVVVAMRGERRVPLRVLGEALDRAFFEAPLRRRLFPSFLGVLRMLKAMDWRRSACEERRSTWVLCCCFPTCCSSVSLQPLTHLFNSRWSCFLLGLRSAVFAPFMSVPGSHGPWETAGGLLRLWGRGHLGR